MDTLMYPSMRHGLGNDGMGQATAPTLTAELGSRAWWHTSPRLIGGALGVTQNRPNYTAYFCIFFVLIFRRVLGFVLGFWRFVQCRQYFYEIFLKICRNMRYNWADFQNYIAYFCIFLKIWDGAPPHKALSLWRDKDPPALIERTDLSSKPTRDERRHAFITRATCLVVVDQTQLRNK